MAALTIWPEDKPGEALVDTVDPAAIAAQLKEVGVHFEQWPTVELPEDASEEDVFAAYKAQIDRITAENNYVLTDLARLRPSDSDDWAEKARAAREKFLSEHIHEDEEDRFFVDGAGVFYLHIGDKVYAVLCQGGDLLSVPRSTRHWFDMGTNPNFAALRFFHDEEGWVAEFTGSPIAQSFPDFDTLASRLVAS